MEFSRRKLTMEAASELRKLPITSVQAYRPVAAPMYVFLKRNEKFISVKGPLDFFTEEELQKYSPFEEFFTSPFIDQTLPFERAGRNLRRLLSFEEEVPLEKPGYPGLAPFELSDASLRIVGPLWGEGLRIEPFFISVFVDQLCDPIPSQNLIQTREKSIAGLELAFYRSAVAVFCAIHLGWCKMPYLNSLRAACFERSASEDPVENPATPSDQIYALSRRWVDLATPGALDPELLAAEDSIIAQKLISRLARVSRELASKTPAPSIYGEEGLALG